MKTDVVATKWQDWTSFALGLWLAVSPWVLGYAQVEGATANAVFVGLALALGAHFEAALDEVSAEWLNIAAGLWLVLAPFLVGFGGQVDAAINSVAVGAAVAVLANSALSLEKGVGRWWQAHAAGYLVLRGPQRRK